MVYQIDTPGIENQAVTNDKIETGTIEINRLDSTLAGALVPVGGIIMWSGTLDQINGFPNWQLCDGSAISSGTLSGTNTPNLTGRFVIGTNVYDTGQNRWEETITGNNTRQGGSKDATLVTHSHTVDNHNHGKGTLAVSNGGNHNHTFQAYGGGGSKTVPSLTFDGGGGLDYNTSSHNGHAHGLTGSTANENPGTDSQGSSATNKNLPPYYALAYIIRIN